jgi:tRNA A-37 threonylcarbamoyl transferase component Bud32
MLESNGMSGNNFNIQYLNLEIDNNKKDLINRFATNFKTGEPPVTIWGDVVVSEASSIFSKDDFNKGSFDLVIPDGKIFFYKTSTDELSGTNRLNELGIQQTPVYSGLVSFDSGEQFLFGEISKLAVNLRNYVLCDQTPTGRGIDSFGILERAGSLLAHIHNQDLVHGNFAVDQLIVIPGMDTPILVYGNSSLTSNASDTLKALDLKRLEESLKRVYPQCDHAAQVKYLQEWYQKSLK